MAVYFKTMTSYIVQSDGLQTLVFDSNIKAAFIILWSLFKRVTPAGDPLPLVIEYT